MEMKNTMLTKWTKLSISTGQICPKDLVKNVRLYQLYVYHLHIYHLNVANFANAFKS
jgi:hypothetical protein